LPAQATSNDNYVEIVKKNTCDIVFMLAEIDRLIVAFEYGYAVAKIDEWQKSA